MLRIFDGGMKLCDGLTRREWMRIGGIGLGGLTLDKLLAQQSVANTSSATLRRGKAKSVIIVGLTGGPPQHDTWDPKPQAPVEVRGPFNPIATKTPGLFVGELMPKTAQLTDKIAVLRAVATNDNAHSSSGYQMLTGVPHIPLNQESAIPKPPNNYPSMGALMRALRPGVGQFPSAVTIPEHIWNDGNFPWPGQDAGFLGPKHDPWLVHCDPSNDGPESVPALNLPKEVPTERFGSRRQLLAQIDTNLESNRCTGTLPDESVNYGMLNQKAMEIIGASRSRGAFDLSQETTAMRDRYGRSRFAQSLLLARRLVESGVSLVQVNWTRVKGFENQGGWDTHAKHNDSLKKMLMPTMDQCYSALLEDLQARGMLDDTLVVWFGEFGHTPKFNGNAGRDHWGSCFSLALAGGGVRGGTVYGTSDKQAAFPVEGKVEPRDFLATIFHLLGYSPDDVVHDAVGRPHPIARGGRVIETIV